MSDLCVLAIFFLTWFLALATLFFFYRYLVRHLRRKRKWHQRIAVIMLIILHLSYWIGGYVVESRRFKVDIFNYYQKDKISVNEQLDLVERDKEPGYLDSLRAKPKIWYRCFSPFPFVFICSEGYVFAPAWGSGRQYIGVFVGFKMVKIIEFWGWIS